MSGDYPTEAELRRIRRWEPGPSLDFWPLMAFVKEIWWQPDWGWNGPNRLRHYHVSTGGWSGNEDIVEALRANRGHFWFFCWWASRRGGHYEFRLPKPLRPKKGTVPVVSQTTQNKEVSAVLKT